MKTVLLIALVILTLHTEAQPANRPAQDILEHLRELRLTAIQRARIMAVLRRQRLEYYLNRKELMEILSDEQKRKLQKWRQRSSADSTSINKKPLINNAKNS